VLVFETHSWSDDNDRGVATGWLPSRLSPRGRDLARELGERRRGGGFSVVLCSDLRRAAETAELAFADSDVPVLLDWRLRECDYGRMNGRPAPEVHGSVAGVDERYPGGESWREAVDRCDAALADIDARWPAGDNRVLVIGHMATYWAIRRRYDGMALDELGRDFTWQEGWTFARPVAEKVVDGGRRDP
jgi:2,3-bisphosphoglycerate-dependent phosphoglycerate mutase